MLVVNFAVNLKNTCYLHNYFLSTNKLFFSKTTQRAEKGRDGREQLSYRGLAYNEKAKESSRFHMASSKYFNVCTKKQLVSQIFYKLTDLIKSLIDAQKFRPVSVGRTKCRRGREIPTPCPSVNCG